MNTWKWSTGEAYYKSARPEKSETTQKQMLRKNMSENNSMKISRMVDK